VEAWIENFPGFRCVADGVARVEGEAALAVMEDPRREFYTSQLVKLELLPKANYFKQAAEIEFYETHFREVKGEEPLSQELGDQAD